MPAKAALLEGQALHGALGRVHVGDTTHSRNEKRHHRSRDCKFGDVAQERVQMHFGGFHGQRRPAGPVDMGELGRQHRA